jgi:hypothetical protein
MFGSGNSKRVVRFNGRVYSTAEGSSTAAPSSDPPPDGRTAGVAETPNAATVEMHLLGTNPDKSTYDATKKIWMRREGPSWKIDDIADSGNETWKGYIEKALAHK